MGGRLLSSRQVKNERRKKKGEEEVVVWWRRGVGLMMWCHLQVAVVCGLVYVAAAAGGGGVRVVGGEKSVVPHTQESQTFVASGSTTKNTGGRKGDISWVWLFYNKVPQDGEPSQCPKNFLCTCKVCAQEGKPVIPYKWKKGTGTGTLARHLESKHGLDAKNYKSGGGKNNQPTMSGYATSAPGGGKPFFYNRQDMIDNMAKYVCMTEQPFTYGDSEELEEFVKLSLQPLYYKVSRQTLKRRFEYNTQLDVDYTIGIVHQLYALYENELSGQCKPTYKKSKMPTNTILDHRLANKIFRKSSSSSSSSTSSSTAHTITEYLNFDHSNVIGQQPDILTWWRNHSAQFPILSKVARDVLVVPASTVASESAFSAARRVLDEKRSSLDSRTVKMCVCKKDWDQAQKRMQGIKDEEEDSTTDDLVSTTGGSSIAETPEEDDAD
ncbi:hypothetical protein KSS87_018283 [Heliosperma pusillum]|nr:hypothetical protein KSS87_018283 [Heliosperma pusillum]